jgi:hypothetical protein
MIPVVLRGGCLLLALTRVRFDRRVTTKAFVRFSILCITATTSIFFNTRALSNDENHWVHDRHGCRAYNPNPHPKTGESFTWNGACKDGYAEGPGLLEWIDENGVSDGWRKGAFEHGNLQGAGEALTVKGGHYQGQFRDGLADGHGTYVFADGTRYDGEFRDGLAEGSGSLVWPNGTRFDGEFKASRRNGHGTIVEPSGARFEGEFKDDRANGHGTIVWPDGYRFEGEFNKDICGGGRGLRTDNAESHDCADPDNRACGSSSIMNSHLPGDPGHVSAHTLALLCAAASKALVSPEFPTR